MTTLTETDPKDGPKHEKVNEFGAGIGALHAFRYKDYRWLWAGNTFSSAAMWIQQTTIGWLAYDLTGSGALLGTLQSVRNLPPLLTAPLAGVFADRYSRNTVVGLSQVLLFINALAIALLIAFDMLEIWHLFVFAILAGGLNAFNQPARQTMVFDSVPREAVANAIALNSVAGNVTRTAGPMLGGGLIVLFGPAENFLVQAAMYLGVLATVYMVKTFPPRIDHSKRRSFFEDMREGYAWVASSPEARLLVLMMALYPGFVIPIHSALMPVFAKDVFHGGAGGLGLLLAAIGLGGVLGGIVAANLNRVDRRGLVQLFALFVLSGSLIGFALLGGLTGQLWVGFVMLVVAGLGGTLFSTINQTVLQMVSPDHMRGRVTGVLNIQPIFSSAGIFIVGIAADLWDPVPVAIVDAGIMMSIGIAVFVFSPRMRDMRLSRLGSETKVV
jgi:MFS family permease